MSNCLNVVLGQQLISISEQYCWLSEYKQLVFNLMRKCTCDSIEVQFPILFLIKIFIGKLILIVFICYGGAVCLYLKVDYNFVKLL